MNRRLLAGVGVALLLAAGLGAAIGAAVWFRRPAPPPDVRGAAPGSVGTPAAPANPPAPPRPAPPEADPVAEQIAAEVGKLKDPRLSPKELEAGLAALAARGNEVGVGTLLALSDEHFQETLVLQTLGRIRNAGQRPRVAEHLRGKLAGANVPVVVAALKSYRQLVGKSCVEDVQGFIRANWARPDGNGEQLCAAAAEVLGEVGTPAAQAALIAELRRVIEPTWLPDYGSVVVAALAKRQTPEAREALNFYADELARKMPAADNPVGRKYIADKVAEARRAAAGEGRPEPPIAPQ